MPFDSWRIWYCLGLQDILARYRGSLLGPFWITLSTAISVGSMGYLYGILLRIDRLAFLPYFTTGIIGWNFLASTLNDSTRILKESKSYLENIQVSPVVYVFRLVFRNLILFAHNLPVYLVVAAVYRIQVDVSLFWLVPALLVVCANAVFYGTAIAFLSARFPDVGSLVSNLLQMMFFLTPVMWTPANLPPAYHFVLNWNPFYYLIRLIRNPLLGISFEIQDGLGIVLLTLLGWLIFLPVIKTFSKRVIFWL